MPVFDLSEVKTGFEVLPEGNYKAKFVGFKNELAPANGKTPYINLEFTITEEGDFTGRKLFAPRYLSKDSLPMLKGTLIALGCEYGNVDTDEQLEAAKGADVVVTVKQSEWEGVTRNKIGNIKK